MSRKHPNGLAILTISLDHGLATRLRAASEVSRTPVSQIIATLAEEFLAGKITIPGVNLSPSVPGAYPNYAPAPAPAAPAYFTPPAPAYAASPIQAPAPTPPIDLHSTTELLPDANERDVLKSRYDFVFYLLNTLANRPADAAKLNPELVNHKAADVLLPNFPEARGWNYQERSVLERRAQTAFERGFYGAYLSGPFVGGLLEISEELGG